MIPAIALHIANLFMRLFRAMGSEARIRRAEQQLCEMDPRLLRDLGIERDQIGGLLRPGSPPESRGRPEPRVLHDAAWQRN